MNPTTMKTLYLFISFSLSNLVLAETTATESQDLQSTLITYEHQGIKFPPVLIQTNIEDDGFLNDFNSYEAFELTDENAYGLPIGIRVIKGLRTKADAASFSSLLLSASLLGIVPVVSNKDFTVRYDIFVQGKSIFDADYKMSSTEVENFWKTSEREMKPQEQVFLEQTIPQFLSDIRDNDEVQAYFEEYIEYYSDL